jgi:hypothetical protein
MMGPGVSILATVVAIGSGALSVQEPRLVQLSFTEQEEDLHAETMRLILEIEIELGRITEELSIAGAHDAELVGPADAGVDDLLRSSIERGEGVVRSIDRVLEIVAHHEGGGT